MRYSYVQDAYRTASLAGTLAQPLKEIGLPLLTSAAVRIDAPLDALGKLPTKDSLLIAFELDKGEESV